MKGKEAREEIGKANSPAKLHVSIRNPCVVLIIFQGSNGHVLGLDDAFGTTEEVYVQIARLLVIAPTSTDFGVSIGVWLGDDAGDQRGEEEDC